MNQHQIMYCCCCISIYVSIHRTITLQITRPWLVIIYKLTLVGVIKHPILIQEQYDVTDGFLTICRKSGWFISLSKWDINQESNHELKILLFFFTKFYYDCQLSPLLLLDCDHCFFSMEVNLVLSIPCFVITNEVTKSDRKIGYSICCHWWKRFKL